MYLTYLQSAAMTPESSIQKPGGETVLEACSRTTTRNPFGQFTHIKLWTFKQGEKWQTIPDTNSQVDFKLEPKRLLTSPDLILEISTQNSTTITMRGSATPEGEEAIIVTLSGIRLEACRNPDAQTIPPTIVGIDHC